MRVLFLTNIPAPYRMDFFLELGKHVELTVLFELEKAQNRDKEWKSEQNDVTYRKVYLKPWLKRTDSAFCPEVISWLKAYCKDTIIVGGYSTPTGMLAIQYLHQKHIPFVLNCDGGMVKKDRLFVKHIKTYFISKASRWLSTGKLCDEYLYHYGANEAGIYRYPFTSVWERDIISYIPNASTKRQYRDALGIGDEHVIIAVGQFIHRKGFDILLKAMKKVSCPCAVYIVGGKETEEYHDLAEQLEHVNVTFLPFMKKELLWNYYQASDVFVLPTREDIWGLVINEAMACGLPVITTDHCVAGMELIEEGSSGYIVPVEAEDILAEKIAFLIRNEELRYHMAENVLRKIRKYTIQEMVSDHMDLVRE